jgi:cysteinyl-tRNA synthetase
MRLFDSAARAVRELVVRDDTATIYVCGITPYDVTHLGHALTYLTFDVLRRHLERHGVRVRHIQNITDVDDDIIRKARELGATPAELTDRNVAWFDADMRALNVLPPHVTPRASGEIEPIQRIVGRLLEQGHAYRAGGDVFFDVSTFAAYGELSHLDRGAMLSENERQRMRPGPRDPLDFLLWQAEAPGEPSWDSPWGRGRPGWHIECSAMALRYGAETLDIHGGGADLIFPHHESEIAQSESFTGIHPFVRTWVHVAMLRYQGEKMSKSLGNLVLVKDLLTTHSADAVRLSLLAVHYRDSRDWTRDALDHATERARRLQAAAEREAAPGEEAVDPAPSLHEFTAALDNDLDTPAALAALDRLADRILAPTGRDVTAARAALRSSAAELGLTLSRTRE